MCFFIYFCYIVLFVLFLCLLGSMELPCRLLKMFWNRSYIFMAFTVVSCLHILLSLFLSLRLTIFQYFTPYCLCVSLLSNVDSTSYLLHSPSFSFALFLPLFLPLWPTKVRAHHVFPIMLSSHPAVRRWTPGRRYKGHDLQGPFATKKERKKH